MGREKAQEAQESESDFVTELTERGHRGRKETDDGGWGAENGGQRTDGKGRILQEETERTEANFLSAISA
jgi:hypothetical protein